MPRSPIMKPRTPLLAMASAGFVVMLFYWFDINDTVILGIVVAVVYVHHVVKIGNLEIDVEYLSSRLNELEEQGGHA